MLKISIIIPSYNTSLFIEETIQSILGQNYCDFECIVMDGGSTDGTLDILRKYNNRIVWKSEKDRGQSDAINKGINLAKGDIIAYLNADDVYEENCFQKVADFFGKNPEAKWAYGKCSIINHNGSEIQKPITWFRNFCLKRCSYNRLLTMNPIAQPAVFWRRELTDEIGLFDVEDHLVMDYEYWLRAGAKYHPGFIPNYLAKFRVHPGAKSSVNPSRAWREGTKAARKYTNSRGLILMRRLISLGIILIYSISKLISKTRKSKGVTHV